MNWLYIIYYIHLSNALFTFINTVSNFLGIKTHSDNRIPLDDSLHDISTIMLLVISLNYQNMLLGLGVLIIHDSSDIFLYISKFLYKTKYKILANISFVILVFVWIYTRLWLLPLHIIYGKDCYPTSFVFKFYLIGSSLLFMLHIYWFTKIISFILNKFASKKINSYILNINKIKNEMLTKNWEWLKNKTYCINLIEREDRLNHAKKESEKIGMPPYVTFHKVSRDPKGGMHGCWISHIEIMKDALSKNLDFALIFEDDIEFDQEVINSAYINTLEQYVKTIDYQLFYIGHLPLWMKKIENTNKDNNKNVSLFNCKSIKTHTYFISKRFMEEMV